jgi:hypothetical protein
METFVGIALGIGLATACGFRVFVPFLVAGLAARADLVPLAGGFEWIESTGAIVVFGVATLLEILAYSIPWVDNLLDAIATPVAVIAGTIAAAAVVTDLPPLVRWTLAVIAGGGIAGAVQSGSVVARGLSTVTTGGLGNFVVSAIELVGAAVMSVLSVVAPLLALALAVLIVAMLVRARRARRARRGSLA